MIERPDWIVASEAGERPAAASSDAALALVGKGLGEWRDHADAAPSLVADLDPDLVADWERSSGLDCRFDALSPDATTAIYRAPVRHAP